MNKRRRHYKGRAKALKKNPENTRKKKQQNYEEKNGVHYQSPGFDSVLEIIRNEIIKPNIATVNITPLELFFI